MRKWRIEDSEELYNINGWGVNYFGINEKGHVYVTPRKDSVKVDLRELMDELAIRDMSAPVLVRFPDILDNRIEKTSNCFEKAAKEYDYKGENFIIYPIKVNQIRPVASAMARNSTWDWKPVPNRNCMRSSLSIPTQPLPSSATVTKTIIT